MSRVSLRERRGRREVGHLTVVAATGAGVAAGAHGAGPAWGAVNQTWVKNGRLADAAWLRIISERDVPVGGDW